MGVGNEGFGGWSGEPDVDVITPLQLLADVNDYDPPGNGTARRLRLSSDALRNVTGLAAGKDGEEKFIHNVGSQNIVLKDASSSSLAQNRFALTGDLTLAADAVAHLQYDGATRVWRSVGGSGGSSGISTVKKDGSSVVTSADTLDFKDFNVEALTGGDAAVYHNLPHIAGGRLTLESGVPVSTTDQTGKTTIYYTPFIHDKISLYDGTRWKVYTFTERSLAIGTLVKAHAYDVFLYDNAGTLTLEAVAWKNATVTMTLANPCVVTWTSHGMSTGDSVTFTTTGALPNGGVNNVAQNQQYWVNVTGANTFNITTSYANVAAGVYLNTSGGGASQSGTHTGYHPQARQTALVQTNGVYLKSGDTTRRYLGTFLTSLATQIEDSATKRFVWNVDNRVRRFMTVTEATNFWTYTTDAWRPANNTEDNKLQIICGLDFVEVEALIICSTQLASTNTAAAKVAVGIDAATTPSGLRGAGLFSGTSSFYAPFASQYVGIPGLGYHSLLWLEKGATGTGTPTCAFIGDDGGSGPQSGMNATIFG